MLVTPKIRLATLQLLHRSMWLKSMHENVSSRDLTRCLAQTSATTRRVWKVTPDTLVLWLASDSLSTWPSARFFLLVV